MYDINLKNVKKGRKFNIIFILAGLFFAAIMIGIVLSLLCVTNWVLILIIFLICLIPLFKNNTYPYDPQEVRSVQDHVSPQSKERYPGKDI